ncbi:MAG: hypothetical protein RL642_86 [Bacteroidota bacterium]
MQYRNIQLKQADFRRKWLIGLLLIVPSFSMAQYWIDYKISPRGDTINRIDRNNRKQGPWWFRYEEVRGEPGFEEEGYFYNDKKQGPWKKFSLMGDLIAREYYIAGHRDGQQLYYNRMGDLIREESWKAVDPAHPYDTIMVPDIDHPERMIKKIIKHESAEIKHGVWKYYDPVMGSVTRTETFVYGQPPQVVSPNKNTTPVKADAKQSPPSPIPTPKKNTTTQKKGKN